MDQEIKTKWLEALRSGKYEQGVGQLCDCEGRYCCLGVLAAIQGADLDTKPDLERRYGNYSFPKDEHTAGLTLQSQDGLAKMNDDGCSFSEIADYIEARL